MKNYDSRQQEAINACGGYYLVLAPPGCGKTDILSERIAKANENGVNFDDMLCLTFTNRASRGMLERVRQRVGEEASGVFVGNVHRFCSNFIYNNALVPENTAIIDEDDITDILLNLDGNYFLNANGEPDKAKVAKVDNIDAYISQRELAQPADSLFLPQEEYESYYKIAVMARFDPLQVGDMRDILKYTLCYRQYKKQHNVISFSDILILAYQGLLHDENQTYKRYRWIQVDEVQDLNALQTAIIDQLTDTSGDFTVMYLGDEQQTIFSFLGAKVGQLDIIKRRCEGHIMTLDTNYRSPSYLLDIYNKFAEDELKVDPRLLPQSMHTSQHEKYDLILTGNNTTDDEQQRVVKMVDYYLQFKNERVAILVPTNNAADRISKQLEENNIRHFKISGHDMFKTKDYKTLASFLSVAVNDFNGMAWVRLLYGIGAVKSNAGGRRLLDMLKTLMMTPSDLLQQKTYLQRFTEDYASKEFVFFDTETTGLNVLSDDIVQIAAFKVKGGKRVENSDLNIFLHTDKHIPEKLGSLDNPLIEAYKANRHYSREEGLQMFLDYIGQDPILGHNVNFDYNILRYNVLDTLKKDISYTIYDSLHLIKCVEPALRMYKLVFLLKELKLEGKNSHLADEDVAATKALVDYCYNKALTVIGKQKEFLAQPRVIFVADKLKSAYSLLSHIQQRLYLPLDKVNNNVASVLESLHDRLTEKKIIADLGRKFGIFVKFAQTEWDEQNITLCEQIAKHVNDMTASINEGDLVNSENLIQERVFIMTIYKGKGLEFDNVVMLEANDGTYPFFTVNRVLDAPWKFTSEEVKKAENDRMEDARKFYVGLSRAKKRLCISYTNFNSRGYPTRVTPFMNCIIKFFNTGKTKNQ